jgi:4,5-DOPA dioxygenase extradiol
MAEARARMPVLFIGHGNPMNAIEDNAFSRAWGEIGDALPGPKAILCVSAHWETEGTAVTAMERPKTIHDFYGFPEALYDVAYAAPGSPELARRVRELLPEARMDAAWGLDHGAWSVLRRLFPRADVPVVQLSLERGKSPPEHYETGRRLRALREEGVLVLGSGNVVHNLRAAVWKDAAYDWAVAFDAWVRDAIRAGDHEALIGYRSRGPSAELALPTDEHYLPLLTVLGAGEEREAVSFFTEKVTLGSVSMRSLRMGDVGGS